MDSPIWNHVSLCSGYGGIDLGLKRVLGGSVRTIAYSEIEAFACELLLARMEGGQIDEAPIWPDLRTFPWAEFRGLVHVLSGGYPCQPFSAAGKRQGKDDSRHLWPWIADGISVCRPDLCFFENVEGHITLGLSTVISDLEAMGYETTWGIFSASEVGAPHQRKRVFILAHAIGGRALGSGEFLGASGKAGQGRADTQENGHRLWPSRPGQPQHWWEPPRVVANSERSGGEEPKHLNADLPSEPSGCGAEAMGNAAQREDHRREPGDMGEAAGEGRCGDDAADGAGEGAELADSRQQWSHGWRNGISGRNGQPSEAVCNAAGSGSEGNGLRQTQPALGGNPDGLAGRVDYAELYLSCDNRNDELRLLGNGVVPATAEQAFRILSQELS